ncbi:PA0069 family radical SAM protein [Piscinibacter sp. Jin2]|uniref:PA0069 family radical SAM protein n=1 Tax=Aquariibacter lacus TaxID=2801332 RepID=A0A9X1BRZ7_9BURK|nr:PA0069 family radical SAM protein [Piscinibacter lacus]MBL0720108.1 PA0069 family radical SAM protein [Piscinibacter lacus]
MRPDPFPPDDAPAPWAEPPAAALPPPTRPLAPRKGRGTVQQPLPRHQAWQREPVDDGWGLPDDEPPPVRRPPEPVEPVEPAARDEPEALPADDAAVDPAADAAVPLRPASPVAPEPADAPAAEPPGPRTTLHPVRVRRMLSSNDSPDVPFSLSLNPYRGCEHGCIYCYARPSHAWLDRSPGLDFETEIEVKTNAVERLREELARPGHRPSPINLGAVTDPYQPAERIWRLSRGLLELLVETGHPFTIVTKGAGIVQDLDLIARAAALGRAAVSISITTQDPRLARLLEPRASAPNARWAAVRRLAEAGVPVAVNAAPIIPFLNEPEIERIAAQAAAHGAVALHYTVLRLPREVAPLFRQWLQDHVPERAERIMARLQSMRGGRDNDSDFRHRMHGEGPWAALIAQRIEQAAARHGLARRLPRLDCSGFRPPAPPPRRRAAAQDAAQVELF